MQSESKLLFDEVAEHQLEKEVEIDQGLLGQVNLYQWTSET